VRVGLQPQEKTPKIKDRTLDKRVVHCLQELERNLPPDERLIIDGLEDRPDLMAQWRKAKRPWWVGKKGRNWACREDVEHMEFERWRD
jgi:hypothetical protein